MFSIWKNQLAKWKQEIKSHPGVGGALPSRQTVNWSTDAAAYEGAIVTIYIPAPFMKDTAAAASGPKSKGKKNKGGKPKK